MRLTANDIGDEQQPVSGISQMTAGHRPTTWVFRRPTAVLWTARQSGEPHSYQRDQQPPGR